MSQRFVRGWKVAPEKMQAMVGSRRWAARDIIKSKGNANCRKEIAMHLGEGNLKKGEALAEAALDAIFEGALDEAQAPAYAQVVELLLNHAALPLGNDEHSQIFMTLTYYIPNAAPGRWNPILEAAKLPVLAEHWGQSNTAFPWSAPASRTPAARCTWPVWTLLQGAVLESVHEELAPFKMTHLATADDGLFSGNKDNVAESREELGMGLKVLRTWVEKARAAEPSDGPAWTAQGSALLLLMNGDA